MTADLDSWLTSDPADDACCEEHGRLKPCPICRAESIEEHQERLREETPT